MKGKMLAVLTGVLVACAAGQAHAATFTVNSLSDAGATGSVADETCDTGGTVGSADECTLRAALQEADGVDDINVTDTIDLRNLSGTIQLTGSPLSVFANANILGPGADRLAVRAEGEAGGYRVLFILGNPGPARTISISGVTLTNGYSGSDIGGGAIATGSNRIVNLDGVALTNNLVVNSTPEGGAIDSLADLTIRNSTFSGNAVRATSPAGGRGSAIVSDQPLTIINSTISGNAVQDIGGSAGAVAVFNNGPVSLTGVTFAGNTTPAPDSPTDLNASIPVTVRNTIFGSGGMNCGFNGVTLTSAGHNLERGGGSCGLNGAGDIVGVDPLLGPLGANGGGTATHVPASNSPVIDSGDSSGLTIDQRGAKRPVDLRTAGPADPADIGAVEVQGSLDPVVQPPPGPAPEPPSPAKLEIARATVLRSARKLDVLAPITQRASGTVRVNFRAAGRTTSFDATVDATNGRVAFSKAIPKSQADKGTGIVTLRYRGDADTQPQEVRLRAAANPASLNAGRPTISSSGRLRATGRISSRARGVVRLQVLYEPPGQSTKTFNAKATIKSGRYTIDTALPTSVRQAIEQRRGVVHSYTLFTGSLAARMRGEMASFEVLGRR